MVYKDEDVNEVIFYESWDIEFEMDSKDNVDGLNEDFLIYVWYAKEDWYSVAEFIIGGLDPIRLDEYESYTWIELIGEEYCQQKILIPSWCWKQRKKEIYQQ